MKKFIFAYWVVSLAVISTVVFWFVAGNECQYIFNLPEGVNTSSACPVDGPMTLGFFVESLIGAVIYILLSALILKKLGFKISRDKK